MVTDEYTGADGRKEYNRRKTKQTGAGGVDLGIH